MQFGVSLPNNYGVDNVVLSMHTHDVDNIHAMMERFAQRVMPAFAA